MQTPEFTHIYGLVDPRCPDVVWYVGKSNNIHARIQYYKKDRYKHKSPVYQWIRLIMDEGVMPEIRILETCAFANWKEREKATIALYRKKNLLLLNKRDGGDGTGVKGPKTHCDKCGTERVQLYPSDGTLRCPVCRKKQRREYEKGWVERNIVSKKAYDKKYFQDNHEHMIVTLREAGRKRRRDAHPDWYVNGVYIGNKEKNELLRLALGSSEAGIASGR